MRLVASEEELHEAADLSETLAEELVRRGEAMLALGRQLLGQSTDLRARASGLTVSVDERYLIEKVSPGIEDTGERSVGKQGEVRIGTAIEKAKVLGTFTRKEFEEATGLSTVAANKWLMKLVNNKPRPIIERVIKGSRGRASMYRYLEYADDPPAPKRRPRHAREVDRAAGVGVDSLATGESAKYTGRVPGRTGKPGRDRRIARKRRQGNN